MELDCTSRVQIMSFQINLGSQDFWRLGRAVQSHFTTSTILENAVLPRSSRNVLRTVKPDRTFHRHGTEKIMTEFVIFWVNSPFKVFPHKTFRHLSSLHAGFPSGNCGGKSPQISDQISSHHQFS